MAQCFHLECKVTHHKCQNKSDSLLRNAIQLQNVTSQPICGPLGPNFDGFCRNNTTKMRSGTFVFVPLLAQELSNLDPKEAELPLRLTSDSLFLQNLLIMFYSYVSFYGDPSYWTSPFTMDHTVSRSK